MKVGNYYGNDHIAAACVWRLMASKSNSGVFKSVKLCLPINLLKITVQRNGTAQEMGREVVFKWI